MNDRNFRQMLESQWSRGNFVCVGLDSEFGKIPESARRSGNEREVSVPDTIVAFNRAIVEATKDLVCAYKPNAAFYEAHGAEGIATLHRTIADIHAIAPDVPVILDAKRADIGNTNAGYVDAAFGFLRADAITVHPYLGAEALQPFLARAEKGIIVLCRTIRGRRKRGRFSFFIFFDILEMYTSITTLLIHATCHALHALSRPTVSITLFVEGIISRQYFLSPLIFNSIFFFSLNIKQNIRFFCTTMCS